VPPALAPALGASLLKHHFTVDVEEYFQVSAFDPYVPRDSWHARESRVERSVAQLLELLARHDARATFFVLGWLGARRPNMVREIAAAGHEIASHGWDHRRVGTETPDEFRVSIRRSKHELEQRTGEAVWGFRAPNFSIVPGLEWAFDVLLEEGYRYDSSIYPARRPGSGFPGAARDPHWVQRSAGALAEIPPAVLRYWGVSLPAGGGAYFRVLPYGLTRAALAACERRAVPGTFYIHPWEIDPEQPRIAVPLRTRLRHYTGLAQVSTRLARLLTEFRFTAIRDTVASSRPVEASACG